MTAQIGERLILDGEEMEMAFCPPLPPDETLLIETNTIGSKRVGEDGHIIFETWEHWVDRDGVKHVELGDGMCTSTACWRGYVGTWKLENRRFSLVALSGGLRLAVQEPLLADWFTGVLRVPRGEMLLYVHMGFGSVSESELHIAIERGRETGRRVIDNTKLDLDEDRLASENLPGRENRFRGDRDFN